MILNMNLSNNAYDIVIESGCINKAKELLNLDRRVLIVTDTGVPFEYAQKIADQSKSPIIITIDQGEKSKSLKNYEKLLKTMLENSFIRTDCVVAVGGGVVGDLAGFCASSFMRGIDFYNIPTTVLSQVDSSIGGKTAVNLSGIKNIVGAFYQPKKVLIDISLLKTLDKRQISNGLSEAVKMALTSDEKLFQMFENEDIEENIEEIIIRSLKIKKDVVEKDEKEHSIRRILNFGHTIGHALESFEKLNGLYHGECVALGMIPMCSEAVRERLIRVLKKLNLPTKVSLDKNAVYRAMIHDKKVDCDGIYIIRVGKIGEYIIKKVDISTLYPDIELICEN